MKQPTEPDRSWRSRLPAIRWRLALLAGLVLLVIYFWQIFVTMPHVIFADGDTGSYLNQEPQRTVAVYYFVKSVLLLWKDLYGVAVAQGILLALFAALLAYAVARLTRSAVLSLAPLLVCLFKTSILQSSRDLSTDGLFPIACIGLMACALLLYDKVSPWRIWCFLLLGFFTCFIRVIGEPLLWSLVVILTLLLWSEHRRVAGLLVAGALGIHALITGISYIKYRIWVPQAQAGIVLIIDAAFIADEQAPPGSGGTYPRDFVAATAPMRAQYRNATGWAEKNQVVFTYIQPILRIGVDTLLRRDSYDFDRTRYDKFKSYGGNVAVILLLNDIFQHAAFAIIRHNPSGYSKLVLMNLITGTHMFTSYGDRSIDWSAEADTMIARLKAYGGVGNPELVSGVMRDPELASLMLKEASDWQNVSLEPKADIAKPFRAFFNLGNTLSNDLTGSPSGLVESQGGILNWLFVIESPIVLLLAAYGWLWRGTINRRIVAVLFLIVPTWGYLFVLCLLFSPYGIYMDATSSFVYLALLIGIWSVITAVSASLWRAVASSQPNTAAHGPN